MAAGETPRKGARPRRRRKASGESEQPVLSREAFAKISEVEGIRLSDEMKEAFAEFDAQGLSHEERRRAILGRFKRTAR